MSREEGNRHSPWALAQMQALPLKSKITMTQQRISQWYDKYWGDIYVSVSGGKDSQVLAHIVKSMYPEVPCVFVNTGLEYNSVRIKGTEIADVVLRPKMSFVEVLTKYGYPIISKEVSLFIHQMQLPQTEKNKNTRNLRLNGIRSDGQKVGTGKIPEAYKFLLDAPFRISNQCCDVMKKQSAAKYERETHNAPVIGTMANESRQRKRQWCKYGCNAFDKKHPSSQPLSFWTEQDILQYIRMYDLKIADVYGDIVYKDDGGLTYSESLFMDDMSLTTTGVNRTGCIFCLFGIMNDTERFVNLKKIEPDKYDYVMRGGHFDNKGLWIPGKDENGVMGLGYKFVIDWLNEHGDMNIKY